MAVRNPIRPATGAEILDLRHFSSADLRPLLDEEVEIWGETLAWDYRSSSEMILRYVDAKILPGYAAVERGSLVGYCVLRLRRQQGRHRRPVRVAAARRCARGRGAPARSRDRDPATVAGGASRGGAVAGAPYRGSRRAFPGQRLSALSPAVSEPGAGGSRTASRWRRRGR